MKRNLNIVCSSNISNISNFESISINNINNIVDCSVDTIVYFCIESMPKEIGKQTFDILCAKLRPQGTIVVKFTDLDHLCRNYQSRIISNTDLITTCNSIINPLNLDEIITYIDISKFKTVNVSRQESSIIVTVQRTSL